MINLTSKKNRKVFWTKWVLARVRKPHLIIKMLVNKEQAADHDILTSLLNRKGLLFYTEMIVELLKRENKIFSLLFVDLDGLKERNDKYGHVEGDRMIKGAAETLKKSTRESDIVGRWGGDEFLVVLPTSGLDGAKKIVDRIFANLPKDLYLTIGIVCWDGKISTDSLIKKADAAMYKAKKRGKAQAFLVE